MLRNTSTSPSVSSTALPGLPTHLSIKWGSFQNQARFLPFSILLNHNLYLDQWMEARLSLPVGREGIYFAEKTRGHWMSGYPIITPVLVTPLYILPAWWVSARLHCHRLHPASS
jgi:hypothetical protein